MRRLPIPVLLFAGAVGCSTLARTPSAGFPGYGILPKEETGATRFLNAHPEYDGRGVVVAIFDTGVDPGAPGLQVTSDGKPKIIDIIDGTGSGDVDTSMVRTAEDGVLVGLSGRALKIDPAWSNPTGQYHLGLKRAYELFPGELVKRLVEKRRKRWDEEQRQAVTELERSVARWDAAHPSPTEDEKKERQELETRLAELRALQEKYDDPGPMYDCVVFHDGQTWRVVIDADEDGDLAEEPLLTDYRREYQYATFGDEDLMNYAVNVYDDGNLLSIVTDSGSHGTHVAGIVAAYFPDHPELHGVAPGAQLVSVKIGDTRLGSTSNGTGEVRGVIAVLQNRCDLINMSYGGPTPDPDRGRLTGIYSELVNKHGVIFVSSAGNEGPALSTAGAPGATTSAILGIGAYISPAMMAVQYSLRQTLPEMQYTWSSRGPTYDGDLGVKLSAPGGAIAPVPNWSLQRNALMNGTSMAAPNACGNIALLLSALKAEGLAYTPHRIRRALENTAREVPGVEIFAQGRGIVQVDAAYEYVRKYAAYEDQDLRFDVRVTGRDDARGIYLREPWEVDRPLDARVTVTPIFHEDADNRAKVNFELRCALEATADWVQCASHLMLMHGGRRFDIRVDPTDLPVGVHYAELRGYDAGCPERGPVFRLPITVIRPLPLSEDEEFTWRETLGFEPGQIERRFFAVPPGATWADLRLRRLDTDNQRVFMLQTVQLLPGASYSDNALDQRITLGPAAQEVRSFKVVGGRTLELCLAQFWSSLGATELEAELTFHGLVPDREEIALAGGELATRVYVSAPLRRERLGPKGSFDTLRQTLRPTKADLRPLSGERDLLPEGRQIRELVLTYDIRMEEMGKITPRVALTLIEEWDESWESMNWMLFDAGRRLLATGNRDPKTVELARGDYVLRFHVRHDDPTLIEKLRDMPLLLDRNLSSNIPLSFFADPDDALAGEPKFSARMLERGDRAALFLTGPAPDKLPQTAQPGDLLLGSVTFGAADTKLGGEGHRPGGFPVSYVVPPRPVDKEKKDSTDARKKADDDPDQPEKPEADRLAEAIRDLKVARLAKLHAAEHRELFDRIAAEVLAEYPNHLPVLVEQLKRADGKQRKENLRAVVEAADRVIAQIDQAALAAHYGVKLDPDDQTAARVRKEMDRQKAALVDALYRKARALYDLAVSGSSIAPESVPSPGPTEGTSVIGDGAWTAFEAAFGELQKWTDTTGDEYLWLHIDRAVHRGRLGEALRLLNRKIADSKPDKELFTKRIELLEKLGWSHWQRYEEKWLLLRFPPAYPPF
jgi:tripeptidyl-peptidase-2